MEDFESKLGQLLGNPDMMGKLMAMAQTLGQAPPPQPEAPPPAPEVDLAALGKLTGLLGKAGVDNQQKALLQALSPYLQSRRIQKLEKAMRAAKLADLATSLLGKGGLGEGGHV